MIPDILLSTSTHILLLAGATWILRRPYHRLPIDRDRGRFLLIVDRWLRGKGLSTYYADVMMAPGRLFILALAHLFSKRDPRKLRIFYTGFQFLTALAFYFVVNLLYGPLTAFFAALTCIFLQNLLIFLPFIANAETLMNLPTILAYGFAMIFGVESSPWMLCCGCLAGCSILFKQSGGFNTALPLGLFLLLRGLWGNFFLFSLGVAVVLGGVWLIHALRGHPWKAFFLHPGIAAICLDYVKSGGVHYNFTHRKKVGYYEYYKNTHHFILLEISWALLAVFFWCTGLSWENFLHQTNEALILFWLGGAVLGILGSGEFIGFHFICLAPPVAIAAVLGIGTLLQNPAGNILELGICGSLLGLALFRQSRAFGRHGKKLLKSQEIFDFSRRCKALAKWLEKRTKPTDTIFYWTGEPELNYYADRDSPTRFNFWVFPNQHLNTRFNHPGGVKDFHGTMEDLERALPRYMVFGSPILDYYELFHLLFRHYREVDYVDEKFRVFRLADHKLSGLPKPWKPKFTMVVVTKNAFKHLKSTLKTLHEQINEDFELIIVDRGSTDETLPWLRCLYRVKVIEDATTPIGEIIRNIGTQARGQFVAVFAAGQMVHTSFSLLVETHFKINTRANILLPLSDYPRLPFPLGDFFKQKTRTEKEKAKKQGTVADKLTLQEKELTHLFTHFAVYRASLLSGEEEHHFRELIEKRGVAVLACDIFVEDDKDLELLNYAEVLSDAPDPLDSQDPPREIPDHGLAPILEGQVSISLRREIETCSAGKEG